MILQSLYSYYQRLAQTDGVDIAREGFAPQKISFALELTPEGAVKDVIDMRVPEGKGGKLVPRTIILPALGKKVPGGDTTPNFLWGSTTFALGSDNKERKRESDYIFPQKAFAEFKRKNLDKTATIQSPEILVFRAFLENWDPSHSPQLPLWDEGLASSNIVFRYQGVFVHENNDACICWSGWPSENEIQGRCLVTGEKTEIARLHPVIKGIRGGQAEKALSSYNKNSFNSFDKDQNLNAPVSKYAAFAYTTALNYLVTQKNQTVLFGTTTAVCWAEKEHPLEQGLIALLTGQEDNGPQADMSTAHERTTLLRTIAQGKNWQGELTDIPLETSLYVLGLAPNAARLAVSFFLQGTAREFLEKIGSYYRELAIIHYETDAEFPSVWQLARAMLAPQKKMDDIARMGGDLLQSILAGYAYPAYVLPAVLNRLRAGENVNAVRAGLIKAVLIRNFNCEVTMKLNPNHPSQAYHLGRVFALLYGLQRKAIPGINAGIRERYYGAASSTPGIVFPLLLGNAHNHIKKAKAGLYDKLITEILGNHVEEFPKHFTQKEQGEFALGYYHQRVNPDSQKAEAEAITPTIENEEA